VGTAAGAAAFSVRGAAVPDVAVVADGVAVAGAVVLPAGARLPVPVPVPVPVPAADGSGEVAGVHEPVGAPPLTVRFTAPGANTFSGALAAFTAALRVAAAAFAAALPTPLGAAATFWAAPPGTVHPLVAAAAPPPQCGSCAAVAAVGEVGVGFGAGVACAETLPATRNTPVLAARTLLRHASDRRRSRM